MQRYKTEGHDTIVLAGAEYGSGSSRDWAAKGPMLLVRTSHMAMQCLYLFSPMCLPHLFLFIIPSQFRELKQSLLKASREFIVVI